MRKSVDVKTQGFKGVRLLYGMCEDEEKHIYSSRTILSYVETMNNEKTLSTLL